MTHDATQPSAGQLPPAQAVDLTALEEALLEYMKQFETVQAEGKSYLDNAIRRGEVCAGGARALVSGRADEGRPEPGADGPSG